MKFNADEIASVIQKEIEQYESELDVREVGTVLDVGDGIAHVYGLSNVMSGEMVAFPSGVNGLAFNLEENSVGIIILGNYLDINEGDEVRALGKLLSVPVGDAVMGRVLDPLGNPLDGKGPVATTDRRPVEFLAPGVAERQPVCEPLQTGIKAIDAMTPIGRGQRELIIGDRKTGKTAIAFDTILNQKQSGVKCFYVAIGQKDSSVAGVIKMLDGSRRDGLHDGDRFRRRQPAPMQYIAPYAGTAMAEHFMFKGQHALIIYDDLSKQAVAYRQLSLLMRRPPGREAYPGDVFYCHSRLLERSVKLSNELRRWLADVTAHHRNTRRGSVGLHSDQRDLHHRRPDLPAAGPVLCRHSSRHERRHFGVPRGWCRPGEGHEEGGRRSATRLGLLPRTGSVRPDGYRTRQGDPVAARSRVPHGRAAEAAAVPADARDGPGHEHLCGHPRPPGRRAGEGCAACGKRRFSSSCMNGGSEVVDELARAKDMNDAIAAKLTAAIKDFSASYQPAAGRVVTA